MADDTSVTVTRKEKGSHELTVENYSLRKQGIGINESIDSDNFMVGGYEWKIRFFPNGKDVGVYSAGRTSLYLALRSDTKDRVPCLFEINLLDQSGKGNHQGRSLFNTFPPDISYFNLGHMDGLLYFIKRDFLETSDYLKDDCLKINCSIQVLTSRIEKLSFKNNADIFVKVADETFRVHNSTLAAHSDVFRSLFNAHQQHNEIVIPDTEPRTFEALLWFTYTGTLLEDEQEALYDCGPSVHKSYMGKVLAAADRFEFKRLKGLCQTCFLKRVSVESVAYLLHLAECCHATELKDGCLRFATKNRAAILVSDGLRYLEEACTSLFQELNGYLEIHSTD